jgi:hypothetical protein
MRYMRGGVGGAKFLLKGNLGEICGAMILMLQWTLCVRILKT